MSRPAEAPIKAWSETPEIGSGRALRFASAAYRRFGSVPCRIAIWPSALYFLLVHGEARRSSLEYLRALHATPGGARALGRRPGLATSLRHFAAFGRNIFDRLMVWAGGEVEIRYTGDEHVRPLSDSGRGGILLGAHVGSFDMMRVLATRYDVPVNVVMFTRHADRINELFRRLDPHSAIRVIQIEPGSLRTAFSIRACLERGEFVALLADRTGLFPGEESHLVPFLGRRASFPLRPFYLAAVLGCPVFTTICLRRDDGAYEMEISPLSEGGVIARGQRQAHVMRMAGIFAQRLEEACLRAPLQWFNFYPFFQDDESA